MAGPPFVVYGQLAVHENLSQFISLTPGSMSRSRHRLCAVGMSDSVKQRLPLSQFGVQIDTVYHPLTRLFL